jgi:pyruvate dehydrogenase E2 component (dihydrolipoamide acetyltransferase)
MPKFGQMTEESAIVEWLKKEGDRVAKGDILFTVETDKSVMEVESFFQGTLLKILVQPGINVPVSSTVGFIGRPGEAIPAVEPPQPMAQKKPEPTPPTATPIAPTPVAAVSSMATPPPPTPPPSVFRISPRAAKLAEDCVIDPTKITGTGPTGRIVEKDVRAYLEAQGYDKLRIAPAAKELAKREGIDILILGRGDARITVADVERAIAEKPKPMSKMRQVIAQRLQHSIVTAPHFFVTVEVDMTDLVALRARLKEQGAPYTVTDFISQAVVLALEEFPGVNSSTDGQTVRWHSHVHLGLAVSLEQGLVVPVVCNADEMTLVEISTASKVLVEKARAGRLAPNEMAGSTFTISNMGMLDVENFTAIINPGESAILAVSSTRKKPVVCDDKIVVRQLMKMTLSSDHRIIDGELAARFINTVKEKLEDVALWNRLTS